MKQELLEYLIRICAKEVIHQLNENSLNPGYIKNAHAFHSDGQGVWCKQCGSEGKIIKTSPMGEKEYSCINKKCKNHKEPPTGLFEDNKYFFRIKGRPAPILGKAFVTEEEHVGITAPPADGQGTADQPAIPKDEPPKNTEPSQPETPKVPKTPQVKGVVFVNPNDKTKLQKVKTFSDDAALERSLHNMASVAVGPNVKIAISTIRSVKNSLRDPNTPLYLYIGKYDPESDEVFLLADKSLQVAKDLSIPPEQLIPSTSTPHSNFDPLMAGGAEFGTQMMNKGKTIPTGLDEELVRLIKKKIAKLFEGK